MSELCFSFPTAFYSALLHTNRRRIPPTNLPISASRIYLPSSSSTLISQGWQLHQIPLVPRPCVPCTPPFRATRPRQCSNLTARPSARATAPTARTNRGSEARVASPLRFHCDTHACPCQLGRIMSLVSEKRTLGVIPHLRAHTSPRHTAARWLSVAPYTCLRRNTPSPASACTYAARIRGAVPALEHSRLPHSQRIVWLPASHRPSAHTYTRLPPDTRAYAGPSAATPRIAACPGADRARCLATGDSVPPHAADLRPHLRARKLHEFLRTMTSRAPVSRRGALSRRYSSHPDLHAPAR
ncbi:hypothetical protein C8R44DRAFT_978543 [Mycena epipterygia]|nr:hypothetical protein C8R44DRAFT_978543 [Mycena epipterygia]